MGNINLDIKSIRANVLNTQDKLKDFSNDTEKFLGMLTNVDTAWNDDTTIPFIKTVEKDREAFLDLVKSINEQAKVTDAFCDDLEASVSGYFGITTLYNIKYIASSTDRSVELLSEIANRINNVRSNLSTLSVPASSSNRTAIKGLLTDVDLTVLSRTQEKISKVISAINKTIENAKYNASKVGKYEMDSNTINFVSSIHTPELKKDETYKEARVAVANAVAKANLSQIAQPKEGDIKDARFNEKINRQNLDDIQYNGKEINATFTAKNATANVLDKKDELINSDYTFNAKDTQAGISDTEARKIADYDYQKKDILSQLADKTDARVKSDYDKRDSIFDANFASPFEANVKEYSGPTKDTSKVLFESGEPSANVNTYEFNENVKSGSLSDAQASSVKDYSYNGDSVGARLSDVQSSGIKDYSFNGENVGASLNDVSVNIKDNYGFREDGGSINLNDAQFNVNDRQYTVNDDNIIE